MKDCTKLVADLRYRAEYLIYWDKEQAPPGTTIRNSDAELMIEATNTIEGLVSNVDKPKLNSAGEPFDNDRNIFICHGIGHYAKIATAGDDEGGN